MLDYITEALKARTDFSAWQVMKAARRSHQLFLIRESTESVRRADTVKYYVTVHREREESGKRVLGESSFVFLDGDDIGPKLDLAAGMAAGVANQPWTLPGPGQHYMGAEIKDASIELNPDKVIAKVRDEIIHCVDGLGDVRLSSAEVFANYTEYTFVNSLGLTASAADTDMMFDFVLLTGEGHGEVESSGFKTVRFYKDLKVGETLRKYAQYARDSLVAVLPENGKFDVVFAEEALDNLFNTFVTHAGGAAIYQGWSRFESGKPAVENPKGELLTLYSNPQLPGMMKSGHFDENGLARKRTEVIKENIYRKPTLDKRYADYLSGEPTGAFANVEVETGVKSAAELLTDGCYELLRFSTFEPNPVTGNFSGEIRTGYRIEGGRRVPIKGGSVQGVITEAFRRAWFSSEKTARSAYRGPAWVKLAGLDLAGE
ncbi:MAG: metallopeptidase TldD-related protein [Nitrospirota bacterium]